MPVLWPRVFKDGSASRHLWVFPLVAGLSWMTTLTTLLVRWLAIGMPRYPGQVNPDVPFISDIAAFTFKPVFVVGCSITGVAFAGTVFAVHHVRYSPSFYRLTEDAQWRQAVSFAAFAAGLAAAICLFLLSVFDTLRAHVYHQYLLMSTFGGLGLSALLTTAVWWDETFGPAKFGGLKRWCIFNSFLMICVAAVGLCFFVFMSTGDNKTAGFLEWTLCYLGSFWLLSFTGYTREGVDPLAVDNERQPLLS